MHMEFAVGTTEIVIGGSRREIDLNRWRPFFQFRNSLLKALDLLGRGDHGPDTRPADARKLKREPLHPPIMSIPDPPSSKDHKTHSFGGVEPFLVEGDAVPDLLFPLLDRVRPDAGGA